MSNKKILIFAPYGAWGVHHQLDAVIGAALRVRGSEVKVIACDGVFDQCFIAGKPPNPETCRQCSVAGLRLFSMLQLPVVQLRSLLTDGDIAEAKAWSDSVPVSGLATAEFEGASLGDWVSSSVHSYYLTVNIDFGKPEVVDMFRKQLRNGALIHRAMRRMLDEFRPDHVFSYNSLHSYYRVAFETARRRGIPVLVHERGLVDDTFLMIDSATANHYNPRWEPWERWKDVPLDAKACEQVRKYFDDRENNKGSNFHPFYNFSSEAADVRRQLRIPPEGRIVAVFASTEREIGSIKGLIRRGFATQTEWLRRVVELMAAKDVYLVIRHHPNNTTKGLADKEFLKAMAELNLEFGNRIRVAMPYEKITSYAILRNAEALFTYYSTTEAEAVLRGVPAVCAAESIYIPMGVEWVDKDSAFPAAIDRAFAKSRSMGLADLRQAYRYSHYLFFKLYFRFTSVGIKDVYGMDIRVSTFDELGEGRDPALDQVCRHILTGSPLYALPVEADKRVSDAEETAFLNGQLEIIRQKRVYPQAGKSAPERLISVLSVPSGSWKDGSPLSRSLKRARHGNIKRTDLAIPRSAGVKELLAALRAEVARAPGEYIHVIPDNVAVDESLHSAAADILAAGESDEINAVVWGAWLADQSRDIKDEFLTEHRDMADFESALKAHPAWSDPFQLLAFFVMRREFLESVCEFLEAFPIASPEEISALFFEAFYEKKQAGKGIHKTGLPMLIVYPPSVAAPAQRAEESEGKRTMAQENDNEAIKLKLGIHADILEKDPYARASILESAQLLKQIGDGEGALSILSHYLGKHGDDAEIRNLSESWRRGGVPAPMAAAGNAGGNRASSPPAAAVTVAAPPARSPEKPNWVAAPANPFAGEKVYATYAEAQPLVETVSGWLLEGQEKFLFDAAKSIPEGGAILEMGADRGRSTTAMGLAVSGSDKRIFSIDTFCGNDGIMGKTYDFYHEWMGNLKRVGVDKHCEGIKGLTFDVLPGWGSRPMLDFVFIDASHEYIDVLKDFRLIYPHVKPGGMIAFHDVEPNWPGPWRVWLEHAVPLLTDHRQVATLTCGRKVGDRDFDWVKKQAGFSFAANWIDDLARAYGSGEALFNAMRASLAFAGAPDFDRDRILQQEQVIRLMPEPLVKTLNCMLGKDAYMDGHLHHWNGMVLMHQGKRDEARAEFMEALKVSYPVHPAQAGHYLAQLGGARAEGPRFPGAQEASASGPAAPAANGHYGKEYFDWQKQIGAFGGVANLFKFRDHVKDSDTVIDFGSGGGFLLRNLPGRMKLGIEINESARKEASLKAGIDAFETAAELPDGCADVIVSNHALEHVHNPLETLRGLRRKLKPGGKMVCVVPHDGPQIAYDPADINKHLYTWNPMTLGNLFAAAGFEGITSENIQHQWPPDFTRVYETAGEAEFHRLSREQAQRNGNYQVRVVAFAGRDAVADGSAQRKADMAAQMADSARSAGYAGLKKPIALDDIPVALIAYKRHEHTAKVLRSLKDAGIRNIHVFCDGAKGAADAEGVERTRKLCRSIDWARPVMHESGENRGLARSIMSAVDGLMEANETLILLEDDCVPQKHFFDFMRKSLNKYRDMEEVFGVSGYTVNIPEPLLARYPHDAYFLSRIGSWGWATWKRAWAKLERDLPKATSEAVGRGINLSQGGTDIPVSLNGILQGTVKDVWTLNWLLTVYLNRGYFVYPTVSHIDNIGMDGTGVHCGVTERYATRLSDREPTRFPDGVILDADLIVNFRKYYDI